MSRSYTHTRTETDLCQRCEHSADWHRHDDSTTPGVDGHNSHGGITSEEAECPYRCIGYDCTTYGPPRGRACDCPGFVRDPERCVCGWVGAARNFPWHLSRTTDDVAGGPCSTCWDEAPEGDGT